MKLRASNPTLESEGVNQADRGAVARGFNSLVVVLRPSGTEIERRALAQFVFPANRHVAAIDFKISSNLSRRFRIHVSQRQTQIATQHRSIDTGIDAEALKVFVLKFFTADLELIFVTPTF